MSAVSIYIHVPFCIHRCGYCDFNTYAGIESLIPAYSKAICMEIEYLSMYSDHKIPVGTIYFGGGTPSLLPAAAIDNILKELNQHFLIPPNSEISLEANPGTLTKAYLKELSAIGINRLSFGMQSANEDEIKLLERQHSVDDVINAVVWSKNAGINNINLDLIFGLPDQEITTWKKSLDIAISLEPKHLSLYSLTIEAGTPLFNKIKKGQLPGPDQDLAADMYDLASEALVVAGYCQYEISNWARTGQDGDLLSCKHNLQYWRSLPYLGIGAGAHGFINHQRTVNIPKPSEYIKELIKNPIVPINGSIFPRTPATKQIIALDENSEIGETMMMGLRLIKEGVSNIIFQSRFGMSLKQRFSSQINKMTALGLVEWVENEEILRLTPRGRLLGNMVFREFI